MKDERSESSQARYVADLDQFVDLVHRLHTPHYEQARRNFTDPDIRDAFADSNEYVPYLQRSLRDIAANAERFHR
jgi:hypothetical protein